MISWGTILYGAALSALVALGAALFVARERKPLAVALVVASALGGPIAWNAVLHARSSNEFFVDAPIALFPVSWQDVGSGVWALALGSVLHGVTQERARRALVLAMVAAIPALLVDIYLY